MGENTDEHETTQDVHRAPQKEADLNSLQLLNLSTPEALDSFEDDMKASNGRCLVLVHPFITFKHKRDYNEVLTNPKYKGVVDYVENLKNLITKAQKDNGKALPILLMHDANTGVMRQDDASVQESQARLIKDLRHFGLSGDFYTILTAQTSPHPLQSSQIPIDHVQSTLSPSAFQTYEKFTKESLSYGRQLVDFFITLKDRGLKRVIIGGEYFGGAPQFGPSYKESRFSPFGGGYTNPILASYYSGRTKRAYGGGGSSLRHPLEIISPEGCTAEVLRGLIFCGIDADMTQVTVPQRIPVTSQISLTDRGGYKVKAR